MSNLDTLRQIIIHLETVADLIQDLELDVSNLQWQKQSSLVADLIHTFTGALYRREKSALVSLSKSSES